MLISATQIAYYHLCHRKLWLFSHGINMEQNSHLVARGKQIDTYSYPQRADKWQQLEIERIKIDYYDPKAKLIREVKKSNRVEQVHIAQVKYYLYVLERNGIPVQKAIIEYPTLRQSEEVWLEEKDKEYIPQWEKAVTEIISATTCPQRINKSICRKCAYFELCYIEEAEAL